MGTNSLAPAPLLDLEIRLFLEGVFQQYHYDFRQYSMASLRRRLVLAMERHGCDTLSSLQSRVLREPELFAQMLQYFTVQVSDLFRDPGYFRALREAVVPLLQTYPSIKVWVAGCSTGEEVWSMAILLRETGLLDRSLVYATDINAQSLKTAEAGVYPIERAAQFSRNYLQAGGTGSLSDYYTAGYEAIVFDRQLKKHIVFADHSLATDHVFSEMHLVSCRNVLIYFDRALQDRAVGLFRDALVPRGFLGLGSKETLRFGAHEHVFEPWQAEERLYRRRP
ncbi:protein-glutamate O-methyltransferase CheR [Aquabacterium soli]|jgi:chemotaxis protein methyltransferase CheR|uniref:Protein-glutamate O-methyltransferase CheR n=1 Tax=Aquabacterium soli TaxID=2493092 RepID=A0A3R8SCD6_9BURK|nr:CheR family methyltransferase [Aquabacterium soli]RRS06299.1 protein-glutamate O-methyltransferase CheR [Aquabacterium soli]